MFHMFVLFCLFWWRLTGVFGAVTNKMSVMEGDSVTLQTGVTKIQYDDDVLWKFGAEMSLIAKISIEKQIISTFDGPDGRFRDRLKLDDKTGSLTIKNITTEHAGRFELEINGVKLMSKIFTVSVYARLLVPNITRDCSSSSSSSCSVVCSVLNVGKVTLSWYEGNSLLSSISVSDLSRSLSLEVKYTDKKAYNCVVNNPISNRTQLLNITELCQPCPDQGLPLLYIVLISTSAGSLLIVVSVVMCCICKRRRKTEVAQKNTKVACWSQEEDRADSALCKPATRKTKSKTEAVYENVPKKR